MYVLLTSNDRMFDVEIIPKNSPVLLGWGKVRLSDND